MGKKVLAMVLATGLLVSAMACGAASASAVETAIVLSDTKITVDGKTASTDTASAVYTGGEIIYYAADKGSDYGEGTASDAHTAAEAAGHTVLTITQPGTYRLSGTLSAGQIFVDLGEGAESDPDAVVTLILDNADVTCTVAPAILFYRVYECSDKTVDTKGVVDTTKAGANVILADGSENAVSGAYVARIYKEGTTKKLHKYDGAFYSKMSLNISGGTKGDGALAITATNEGLDSELHLTINGGNIAINAQDDGINTNEDFISVFTMNGGTLRVSGGLGSEGDGIDSNGYLTLNGGTVITSANQQSPDGGLDADGAITLNGGTVIALGTRNDSVDSASQQVYLELSLAATRPAGSVVVVTDADGSELLNFTTERNAQSITLSSPALKENATYHVTIDGVRQQYTGNRFGGMGGGGMGGGGMGGGGTRPDGMTPPDGTTRPDGMTLPDGTTRPDGMTPPDGTTRPDGMTPPDGMTFPDGMTPPDGMTFPDGTGGTAEESGEPSADFIPTASVRSFSGVSDWTEESGKTKVTFAVNGGQGIASVASGKTPVLTGVTPSADVPAGDVQLTITDVPSENYAESCLLSAGADGLTAILPTADGTYRLTVAVVSGNETYTGSAQYQFTIGALPFVDLSTQSGYYAAVKELYDAGILQGTAENRFSPDATVTRATAVTVLARMAQAVPDEGNDFSDVTAASWYSGYVGWAAASAIVEGDGNGHFYPETEITTAQMTLILARYAKATGVAYTAPVDPPETPLTRGALAQMLADFRL